MTAPVLTRRTVGGVTLLGDERRPGGVTLAFTERTGGVSLPPYASLNLGSRCGDDPAAVIENRRRALAAIGAEDLAANLVEPRQVHGSEVVVVRSSDAPSLAASREEAASGRDAVVCTCADVPVLLCYADCVPVVLVAPGGFAVVHSGWRGTIARISARALSVLCSETGAAPGEVLAYVGPHILAGDYEVSADLADRFAGEFGPEARVGERNLDLTFCVDAALLDAGMARGSICHAGVSTPRATDRFYSYRAEGGTCGRHAALAFMGDDSHA